MEDLLPQSDIMIIEKEMTRKSLSAIAYLIDLPVEELRPIAMMLAEKNGVVLYQQALDDKRQQTRLSKPSKPKKEKKKKPVVYSRIVTPDKANDHVRRIDRHYKTKEVDFSQMISVRIDYRTTVLAQPGEDPAEVRRKYYENLELARKPFKRGVAIH